MSLKINAYSNARKEIALWLDNLNIPRNDNIVGRIGEYYAINYFQRKFPEVNIVPATKQNQAGYDFSIADKNYSVKTITHENKNGSTSPIRFNDSWHYLVAVKLDEDFNVEALSVIDYKTLKKALDKNSINQGKLPNVKKNFRWWKLLNDDDYRKV